MIPILKSLLIPGWGQLDFDKRSAFLMFGSEIFLISTYLFKTKEINSIESNYKIWAYNYSNCTDFSDKRIYQIIEDFYSKEFFLINLYDEARRRYPDDLQAQQTYINLNNINAQWEWQDIEKFFYYQDLRSKYRSIRAFRDIIGFTILANHIISAIHTFLFYPEDKINMGFYPTYNGFKFQVFIKL
ncbi:MAG: hypothetical protein ABIL49_03465 [candidate division WOR-3 bacterium]|mgnify:CR=1 FL=1|jgi:hypothetical protein